MFSLLNSLAELVGDVATVVTKPVEAVLDIADAVVKPVAAVVTELADDIKHLKD